MLVQNFLETSAKLFPEKDALIFKNRRLNYSEIDELANSLAHTLVQQGLLPRDRVAVCLPNCPEAAIAIFGILKASGVFVVLHPSIKKKKLGYILNNCRASALICAEQQAKIVRNNQKGFPTVHTVIQKGGRVSDIGLSDILSFEDSIRLPASSPPPCGTSDRDIACIIYTSGSTGEPKGVVCGHDNVDFVSNSIITYLENTAEDVVINVLPFSFDYGLYQMLMVFRFGGTLILEPTFVYPNEIIKKIESEKVTGFPVVPTILAILLQRGWQPEKLRTLRYMTNTAAALPVNHIRNIREKLPWVKFYSMYGLTECKRALYLPPEQIDERPGSVGIAIPGTKAWLEEEPGHQSTPSVTGELVIQGPHVMRGYWEDPEATAAIYRDALTAADRILYSGDLFRMDEEGYYYFVSRKDDIIKSRGEKISPREIEDPVLGQKIKLFVVSSDPSLTEMQVKYRCSRTLEDFMVPQIVEIRESLPKTEGGKIKKSALR
jgi:long-chain acyl-CoA synthetase